MITKNIRTIQESGQIQLPTNDRNALGIEKGDKIIVGLDKNKKNQLYIACYKPETKEDREYLQLFNNDKK